MTGLVIGAFEHELEILEVYWLAGFYHQTDLGWQIRVVMRGMLSGKFLVRSLPIGMYPMLTLGAHFEDGQLLPFHSRGVTGTATIPNVAEGEEVGSDRLPVGLYSFGSHRGGVQHLLKYATEQGVIFIPTAELMRFLFACNKTMANALMVPGSLMTLHQQQAFESGKPLHLSFSGDMPLRLLSQSFVQEFAWLAYDKSARTSWESVYAETVGKSHVSFVPPDIPNSTWTFRGIEHNGTWLVLELQHLSGRSVPCGKLSFSHPSLVHRPRQVKPGKVRKRSGTGDRNDLSRYRACADDTGSRTDRDQVETPIPSRSADFINPVNATKVWKTEKPTTKPSRKSGEVSTQGRPWCDTAVSVGPQAPLSRVQPIEFEFLEAVGWEELGRLEPMARVIRLMAELRPNVQLAMTLCKLPPGRAFSTAERRSRVCLIAILTEVDQPELVIVDIDRSGERAISTLVITADPTLRSSTLEGLIRQVLTDAVLNGGHWGHDLEVRLSSLATVFRLPRILNRNHTKYSQTYLAQVARRLQFRIVKSLTLCGSAGSCTGS
jgi:hypothetical protein